MATITYCMDYKCNSILNSRNMDLLRLPMDILVLFLGFCTREKESPSEI